MKKQLIAAALITAMFASLASCGKSSKAADTNYIYGKIDSISGNDVVLLLAEENTDNTGAENDEEDTGTSEKKSSGKHSGRNKGEKPEGFTKPENGEMPSGFDPENFKGKMPEGFTKPENGEMPSGFDPENFKGEMPEGFTRPENGEMPSGFDPENFKGEMPEGFSRPENGEKPERGGNNSKYTLTGEQEEVRIPVGTDVTTSDGVKTDFDALKAGNIIKCSVEKDSDGKDLVKEVWIVE
ncbi:hypothetical protein [uncultured Ruminococcus sp.]|uniref:hypothetical protein n=1 Tax=uncultured Ruminococcus sp. TaxID=165186 RepID=UPI00262B9A18|nr:hypothetical protein [uncultured Ruminococcus sp.]